mmetsp:Transcript_46496/g.120682  ORF Transcript_46496/g.120682 Transcript_46496/m.120682 type:complete len:347 (-) Transcript_46496:367-1407(-)
MINRGRNAGVGHELQRVGRAGVLGERDVAVVHFTSGLIPNNVLEDRAVPDGRVHLWLLLWREIDGLGVAAALDVEDALCGPHVLVVPDEVALRVGAERGRASPAQAEEEGDVVLGPDVGGRVRGRGALRGRESSPRLQRHQAVHDCEDALLQLPRVLSPQDHHLLALERNGDGGGGGHALRAAVRGEDASVVDHKGVLELFCELLLRRRHEHVLHEEGVVCPSGYHAHWHSIVLVPAAEAVDHVQALAGVQVIDSALTVGQESVLWQLDVHLAPPHVVLRVLLHDHALVHRRPASLDAATHCQRPRGYDAAARLVRDGPLVQYTGWRVVVDLIDVGHELVVLAYSL